jgi:murein DD-endopeptidase MepM/ murein hydrolase activator NlpD
MRFSGIFIRWPIALLLMAALLCLPDLALADTVYVVRRGDTLTGIAKKHGLSVAKLADYNGLARNHYVTAGQRLRIPGSAKAPPSTSPVLPKSMADTVKNAPVKAGRWKYIVIHHSGVDEGTVKGMDRYHREVRRMENGLAYHFVIGNGHGMGDGEIAAGPRWRPQLAGGHLRSEYQNQISIGICLVGNYDKHGPSPAQLRSLTALTRALMNRCDIPLSGVKTHQQINVVHTRCPGSKFPTRSFIETLRY